MEEDCSDFKVNSSFSLEDKLKPGERITCISGSPSELFIGTSKGEIHHASYKGGRFRTIGTITLPKSCYVYQMHYASALNLLLVVCGGVYFEIELEGFTTILSKNDVCCFAVNGNPTTDDPFTLLIAFGHESKGMLIARRTPAGIDTMFKTNTTSTVRTLSFSGNTICYATSDNYFLLDVSTRTTMPLFPINDVSPCIATTNSNEFLVRATDELAVFVLSNGTSSRPPAIISNGALLLLYKKPFVVFISSTGVHFVGDNTTQTVALPNALSLVCLDGALYVAGESTVYAIGERTLDQKIKKLVESKHYDAAIKAYEDKLAESFSEELLLGLHALKENIGYVKIANKEFEDAASLLIESNADVNQLISRIHTDPVYSEPCFHVFLKEFLLSIRSSPEMTSVKHTIDAAVLQLCIDNHSMYDLSELRDFAPDSSLAVELYKKAKMFSQAADISWKEKKWKEACDLWILAVDQGESVDKKSIVSKLYECEDMPTVRNLLRFLVSSLPDEIESFLITSSVSISDAREILNGLPQWETYLEDHAPSDAIALELSEVLTTKILAGDMTSRRRLRTLLLKAHSTDLILPLLDNPVFCVEKELLTSQNPKESLQRILSVYGDHDAAELLCAKYAASHPDLGIQLLQHYLSSDTNDPEVMKRIASLLASFGEHVNASTVLTKLPENFNLNQLAGFLKHSVSSKIHAESINTLKLTLLEKAYSNQQLLAMKTPRVELTETSVCPACTQLLGYEDPLLFLPTGFVIHNRCLKHPRLCPVTNALF